MAPALLVLAVSLPAALAGCVADDAQVQQAGQARVVPPGQIDGSNEDAAFLRVLVVDVELFPVSGAFVFINPTRLEAFTDDGGLVAFGPLEPGDYTLVVERRGYAPVDTVVEIRNRGTTEVVVELDPVASDVPYSVTEIFDAYVMCHFVSPQTPIGGANVPCAAAIDLVLGTAGQPGGITPDKWIYPFSIERPGFKGLVLEMIWEKQTMGADGLLQLTSKGVIDATGGTGVTVGGTVYGDTQGDPFHAVLTAGNSYWTRSGQPVYFYPEENATEAFELLIAGGGGNTSVPGLGMFLEFRPTVFISQFYNRAPTWAFSALPDE